MTPELSRPVVLDRVRAEGITIAVEATPNECAALARRFAIPGVVALTCAFTLRPAAGAAIEATGHLCARVVQTCVVGLEDFETSVEESFTLRFVPEGTETDDLDPESDDEIPYSGDTVDLGEATAEQLALALDPYPRAPDASPPGGDDAPDAATSPFAGLSRLRGRLS